MPNLRHVIAVLSCALLLSAACTVDTAPGTSGDCSVRVEHRSAVYRPTNNVRSDAPRAGELGPGQALDCDGEPIEGFGVTTVVALAGVDTTIAVAVVGDDDNTDLDGVYIRDDIDPGDLPDQLLE